MNPCQGDALFSGLPLSHSPTGQSPCSSSTLSYGAKARQKNLKLDTSIGSLSLGCQENSVSSEQKNCFVTPVILSPPAQLRLKHTYGRKQQESPEASSSSDLSPSIRQAKRIGSWYGKPHVLDEYWKSVQILEFSITGPCDVLLVTIRPLSKLCEHAGSTGVNLELVSLEGPGKKQLSLLTLKVQELNFGMATKVKSVLCSMNFVEGSTYHTYCDGLTVTHVEWKSRDPQCLFV